MIRRTTGLEIDLIIEKSDECIPVEIKSGKTIQESFFKNLRYWQKLSGSKKSTLIYSGEIEQKRSNGRSVKLEKYL